MTGWIKLHRRLKEKPIWTASNCLQKALLVTLLLLANHKENEWEWRGKPFRAKPGQFVTSVPKLMEEIGKEATEQKVRTALERFKKYEFICYSEPEIAAMGIGRKFQKPTVFAELSVFENLELALKTHKGIAASMLFKLSGAQKDRIAEVLNTIHLAGSVTRQAGLLSHGQKQWLEIGMLLVQEPKLLLLDEPVAGMTDEETVRTAELFLTLKGKHSLRVVEHDMSFIDTISEKVTVLCDGSVLAEGTLAQVQADERVIEVYLGR